MGKKKSDKHAKVPVEVDVLRPDSIYSGVTTLRRKPDPGTATKKGDGPEDLHEYGERAGEIFVDAPPGKQPISELQGQMIEVGGEVMLVKQVDAVATASAKESKGKPPKKTEGDEGAGAKKLIKLTVARGQMGTAPARHSGTGGTKVRTLPTFSSTVKGSSPAPLMRLSAQGVSRKGSLRDDPFAPEEGGKFLDDHAANPLSQLHSAGSHQWHVASPVSMRAAQAKRGLTFNMVPHGARNGGAMRNSPKKAGMSGNSDIAEDSPLALVGGREEDEGGEEGGGGGD